MNSLKQLQEHATSLGLKVNNRLAFLMAEVNTFQFMFTFPDVKYNERDVLFEFRVGDKPYHLNMTPERFLLIDKELLLELQIFNSTHNEQYEELIRNTKQLRVLAKQSLKDLLR